MLFYILQIFLWFIYDAKVMSISFNTSWLHSWPRQQALQFLRWSFEFSHWVPREPSSLQLHETPRPLLL
eukprot:m.69465 g.69465  ORF g.69465 m.69465 type:complete len:69 (-) comp12057_c0_seq3:2146-2352(-)